MFCWRVSAHDLFYPNKWYCRTPKGTEIIANTRLEAITEAINYYFTGTTSIDVAILK